MTVTSLWYPTRQGAVLYGGDAVVSLDEETHKYTAEYPTNALKPLDAPLVSTTTLIERVIDKSEGLNRWAANTASDILRERYARWSHLTADDFKDAREGFITSRNASAWIGNYNHNAMERWLLTGEEPAAPEYTGPLTEEKDALEARAMTLWEHVKACLKNPPFEATCVERPILIPNWGVAGTLDLEGKDDMGRFCIGDLKTGTWKIRQIRLQTASYLLGRAVEVQHTHGKDAMAEMLSSAQRWVLHAPAKKPEKSRWVNVTAKYPNDVDVDGFKKAVDFFRGWLTV